MPNTFYRRKLPHWQPAGAIFFVTFRVYGSLPAPVEAYLKEQANILAKLRQEQPECAAEFDLQWKKLFLYADESLDKRCCELGESNFFRLPARGLEMATFIKKGYLLRRFQLHRYCVMPNHVHLLIEPLPCNIACGDLGAPTWPPLFAAERRHLLWKQESDAAGAEWPPLWKILKGLKRASSAWASDEGHQGPLWQPESFDHWVRNRDEYEKIIGYIDNNPVKAGLCRCPHDWPASTAAENYQR